MRILLDESLPRDQRDLSARRLVAALLLVALASAVAQADAGDRAPERDRMVSQQIVERGVRDSRVLAAMREVPRHRFVPEAIAARAYQDTPLPIGLEQTISQPYIVARMTELLDLVPTDRVFELGTGSGYQAAVASRIAGRIFTIEILPELALRARTVLAELGYGNVTVRTGDGFRGWPEEAPFDKILVTAAVREVPKALVDQLRVGGRAVLPVGEPGRVQTLVLLEKKPSGELVTTNVLDVRFVPATGGGP